MKSFKDRKLLLSLLALGLFAGISGRFFEVASHANLPQASDLSSASAILATEQNIASTTPVYPDITLGFAGNIIFTQSLASRVVKNYGGDYAPLFASSDFLKNEDMTFANVEGSVNGQNMAQTLKDSGISVVALTGSHILDNGRIAFENSLAALHSGGVSVCGAGLTKSDAETPAVLSKDGFTVGYLCFSDIASDTAAATDTQSGVLLASDPDFDTIIQAAAKKVNALVVVFDFGGSGSNHNARQESLAKEAAADGAVMVVGAHPVAAEDIASYNGVPVVYSLGTFVSDEAVDDSNGIFVTANLNNKTVSNVQSQNLSFGKDFIPYLAK